MPFYLHTTSHLYSQISRPGMTFRLKSLTAPFRQGSKPSSGFIPPLIKTNGNISPLESYKLSKAVQTVVSNHFFLIFIKLHPKASGISTLPLFLEGTHFSSDCQSYFIHGIIKVGKEL